MAHTIPNDIRGIIDRIDNELATGGGEPYISVDDDSHDAHRIQFIVNHYEENGYDVERKPVNHNPSDAPLIRLTHYHLILKKRQ